MNSFNIPEWVSLANQLFEPTIGSGLNALGKKKGGNPHRNKQN
jgi:hypothetical protein